jgi:hypothetical protein
VNAHKLPATAQQRTHRLPCVVTSAPSLGEGAVLITADAGSMPRGDFLTAALAIFSPRHAVSPNVRLLLKPTSARCFVGEMLTKRKQSGMPGSRKSRNGICIRQSWRKRR